MVEGIEIRPFKYEDLQAVVSAWNEVLHHDVLTPDRFMSRVVLDENFYPDLAPVAMKDGRVVGFCLGVRRRYPYLTRGTEPERGWIVALFVAPAFRRKGIATALVHEVESRLGAFGVSEVTIGAYSPNYFMPGVDGSYEGGMEFFDALGYDDRGEAVSMWRDLFDYRVPDDTRLRLDELAARGFHIARYEARWFASLVSLAECEFGAGWHKNIVDAVRAHEAEDTILVALDGCDEVVGFCMRKIDGNDERFGPIGVRADLRSQGLGGVLLDMQMLEMKKQGINCLYFLWTSGAAIRFYERHGFKVFRRYRLSRKLLAIQRG